jgi:hypothetical protein
MNEVLDLLKETEPSNVWIGITFDDWINRREDIRE